MRRMLVGVLCQIKHEDWHPPFCLPDGTLNRVLAVEEAVEHSRTPPVSFPHVLLETVQVIA